MNKFAPKKLQLSDGDEFSAAPPHTGERSSSHPQLSLAYRANAMNQILGRNTPRKDPAERRRTLKSAGLTIMAVNRLGKLGDEAKRRHHDQVPPAPDFEFPDTFYVRVMYIISLPLMGMFRISVPDCRREGWESWYMGTFGMSIVWIAILSYYMVLWTSKI